jgi:hypothetical protein
VSGCIDLASPGEAPPGVMHERSHALDDMPVPTERQPSKDVEVVTDERLAVEDDCEEVDRHVPRRIRHAGIVRKPRRTPAPASTTAWLACDGC